MKEHPSKFKGMESPLESLVMVPFRILRQQLFSPFTALLARIGVTADMISFAALVPALGFCVMAPLNFSIALWLMVAALMCDGLDGVLARQTGASNLGGAFTDTCCDLAVLTCFLAGLVWYGTVNPVLALFFLFMYTFFGIFFVLHHLVHASTRWLMRPGKSLFCLVLFIDFMFHVRLVDALLFIYLLAFPLLGVSFWRLKKALASHS